MFGYKFVKIDEIIDLKDKIFDLTLQIASMRNAINKVSTENAKLKNEISMMYLDARPNRVDVVYPHQNQQRKQQEQQASLSSSVTNSLGMNSESNYFANVAMLAAVEDSKSTGHANQQWAGSSSSCNSTKSYKDSSSDYTPSHDYSSSSSSSSYDSSSSSCGGGD